MPKRTGQKLRILEIYRYLLHESDEEHPITLLSLGEHLARAGYPSDRKTLMDDLHALEGAGVDILSSRGRGGGYYIGAREFEGAELKLLVDAVQSSRFISEGKSRRLIDKLLSQTSRHDALRLGRSVYVSGRVKTENVELLTVVDAIHTAILADKQISFLYYDWTVRHEFLPRHGGRRYLVSPCMLSWDSEYYYLLAYDAAKGELRHYRVDKMRRISVEESGREGGELWERIVRDPVSYDTALFGMFGGEAETVLLSVDASLAGVIVDRFGEDVPFLSDGEGAGTFRVAVRVSVSPVFLAWVIQFGGKVRILSPSHVKDAMLSLADAAMRACSDEYRGEQKKDS